MLVAGLVVSACAARPASNAEITGSSTNPAAPAITASEGVSTTTPASTKGTSTGSAEVQKAAEASLITLTDVPAGFTTSAPSSSDSTNPLLGVAECAPYQEAIKAGDESTAKAEASFKNTATDEIDNKVEVYGDSQVVTGQADLLADPGFPACLVAGFRSGLKSGMPEGSSITVKVTKADVASAAELGVDSAAAFTFGIEVLTAEGRSVKLTIEVVGLTYGRATSELTTTTQGPTPIDLGATVQAAANKLKANAPT